jgi:hypothetical protein
MPKKIWHIYTLEFYIDIKKNEIMLLVRKMGLTGDHHVK